jgi:NTE family protein
VLDQPGTQRRVAFQVDLFPARGELPRTLPEVDEREKDIRFSSRTRMNTTIEVQQQAIAQAARRLVAKLPRVCATTRTRSRSPRCAARPRSRSST